MADDEEKEERPGLIFTCSICDSEFDMDAEGGIAGSFGILPVAFCVWCYASITDMVTQGYDEEDPPTFQ